MNDFNIICCPACKGKLKKKTGGVTCSNCYREYSVNEGILDFLFEDGIYWGEIEQDEMLEILKNAKANNWWTALYYGLKKRKNLFDYIVDPNRLGWLFHCYDDNKRHTCVDLGSGWGSLSFELSKYYQNVISIEGVAERIQFQAIRASAEGVNNITFLRNNSFQIPVSDSVADLVVLNGVLEWIGLNEKKSSVRAAQLEFLKEVKRILKPDGVVYIGIENRIGFMYFLGAKDHSGYPFTSLMPRFLANLSIRLFTSMGSIFKKSNFHHFSSQEIGYHTYTYSYRGYKQLLRDAGFNDIDFYWSWPGYSYPKMSGSFNGLAIKYVIKKMRDSMDNRLIRLFLSVLSIFPEVILSLLLRVFSQYYLIIAKLSVQQGTIQKKIYTPHNQNNDREQSILRMTLGEKTILSTTFFKFINRHLNSIYKVGSIDTRGFSTFVIQEEEANLGRTMRPYVKNDLRKAMNWLVKYQNDTKSGYWSTKQLEDEITAYQYEVSSVFGKREFFEETKRYLDFYLRQIEKYDIPYVSEHGDFTPNNILIHNGEVIPIDWEFYKEKGHPYRDLGAFSFGLLRRGKKYVGHNYKEQDNSYYDLFSSIYNENFPFPVHIASGYFLLSRMYNICQDDIPEGIKFWGLSKWAPFFGQFLNWIDLN